MQVVYERCCGLDIHKKLVVACLIVLVGRKEGYLFRAHPVVSHESRDDAGADLDEDVFAGTHGGYFLRN